MAFYTKLFILVKYFFCCRWQTSIERMKAAHSPIDALFAKVSPLAANERAPALPPLSAPQAIALWPPSAERRAPNLPTTPPP